MSASDTRLTIGRPCGQKYGVSVAPSSAIRRSISSRASGMFAFTAARHATNASARSTAGSPAFGPPSSSTAAWRSRLGSSPFRSAGTALTTIASPPKPSKAKPRRSSGARQRSRSARPAGPRSTGSGKSSACDAGAPRSSSRRRRSKMTRSCATCWSRKKTSASDAETTKVSCTWPSTRPKRGRASPDASPKSAGCSATAASPAPRSSGSPPVPADATIS